MNALSFFLSFLTFIFFFLHFAVGVFGSSHSNLVADPDASFAFSGGGGWNGRGGSSNNDDDDDDDPVFDNSLVTNVTAQFGNSAHLPCTVLNIKKNNPVSSVFKFSS
jgi:hypothetical protein